MDKSDIPGEWYITFSKGMSESRLCQVAFRLSEVDLHTCTFIVGILADNMELQIGSFEAHVSPFRQEQEHETDRVYLSSPGQHYKDIIIIIIIIISSINTVH